MDLYDYLKADHDKVSALFVKFEKSEDKKTKIEVVDMLLHLLVIHSESEQETFYDALKKFEKSQDLALHSEQEHAEIKHTIAQILADTHQGKAWETKVTKLKELVDHHVKEEEGKIFRAAKKVLTEDEANRIKEKMHDLKEKLARHKS